MPTEWMRERNAMVAAATELRKVAEELPASSAVRTRLLEESDRWSAKAGLRGHEPC